MDMVRATFCLTYPYPFPLTKLAQNFSYGSLLFPIENLTPIFGGKYYMIFAVLFGMG